MAYNPETLSGLTNVNNDVFFNQDVTFYGKVNLDNVIISGSSISFSKNIEFTGGDITVRKLNSTDIITQNINAGITTLSDIHVGGRLFDGDDNFGTAGQVLSSDGNDLEWINTSSANVGSATNVGVNLNATNANQWITFIGANSGNNPIRVDDGLRYNPSTNTISEVNFSGTSRFANIRVDGQLLDGDGDFGSSGQVLASDGTNTNWVNAGDLTAGAAAQVGVTDTDANTNFHPTFVANTTGNDNIRVDSNLTYNASSNTLTAGTFSGNASASNLNSGTIPNARFPATLPAVSGANLTNLPAGNLTGTLPAIDGSNLTGIVSIPTGVIVMWSGAVSSIPAGWTLCNGSNNTPDLRSRFIVGATGDGSNNVTFNADTGAVSSNYSVGVTGGSVAHQLTVDEMPSHSHVYSRAASPGGGQDQAGSGSGDAVNHSNQNTSSQGSSDFHENRPPYYALAFIMKT